MFNLEVIGAGLPVAKQESALRQALAAGGAVVQAPPGTGKTTFVPPLAANLVAGKVLVTAPRRVAVRAAARRLASLAGQELGQDVGYRVHADTVPGARVEFCTPGVLLRMLLSDAELPGVDAIIIDEVHERQLDTDLVLGMAAELALLREDLRLVVMSATVDTARYQQLLGLDVVSTPAVTHPLEVEYRAHPGRGQRTREFWAAVADTARGELGDYSVLVFVPGRWEAEYVAGRCGGIALHGGASSREQDAALRDTGPRIVVSTALAESSVTVPGVRTVVDAGLSRVPRRDENRGMTGLVTVSEARSTAEQRAGRAGREGPGRVVRMFTESEFRHFPAHITPEILSADLTQATLWLKCWGSPDLPLLDAPPAASLQSAEETLHRLGALDGEEVTPLGKKLARMPLDPRLGRALLDTGGVDTVARLSAREGGDWKKEAARLRRFVKPRAVEPGVVIGSAYPEWIGRREKDSYLLASGTRVEAPASSDWIACSEISRTGNRAVVRDSAPIAEADALRLIGVTETTEAWLENGAVRGRRVRRAGAIELSSTPVKPDRDAARGALRDAGPELFTFYQAARELLDRIRFLHEQVGEPWPGETPEGWLDPEIEQVVGGARAGGIDMYPAVQRLLPWPEATRLEELAPARLPVPSGSNPKVDYSSGRPVVRVKLQECFGLAASPECAGVRVQFHLLSPAGRELAITDDLASFWNGPYAGVRADMRGRYPKHPWPEDPWTAPATARTKKRM